MVMPNIDHFGAFSILYHRKGDFIINNILTSESYRRRSILWKIVSKVGFS